MWLCSCHHRPSPELLRLAKPKPSPRNVNPPPLPFLSLPRPLGTPIPLSLPTGGTTQAPPVSGRPLGTRRLSSGVCPACLTQQNAPRAPRVPWRVSACRGVCPPRRPRDIPLHGRSARCLCRLSRPRVRGGLRPRSGPRDKRCTNLGERKPPADPAFFQAQTRRGNRWVTRSQRCLTLRTHQGFSHVTSEHSKCS